MKEFLLRRKEREKRAQITGIVMTVFLHLCGLCVVTFSGIKYIYPPPPESTFLLDFEDADAAEEPKGQEPTAKDIDKSEPINLVQKSEAPKEAEAENLTPESKPDDFGDVPVKEPVKEEPALDPRAAFPGMAKKDTTLTAEHAADKASDSFKAGQAAGNTANGVTSGKPNARLKGRNTMGDIPRPAYPGQNGGIVVVTIWVDQYGTVRKAIPGSDGTTVTDKSLWAAARNAAMETHFNMDADAPAMQEGTITYIFNLK